MSAFSRNLCSTASRTLRQRSTVLSRAVRPIALRAAPTASIAPRAATASSFSTMASLKSAAPPVSGKREYDPEIKDIANYIHNVNIDSVLAVWPIEYTRGVRANSRFSSTTQHDGSSLTLWAVVLRACSSSSARTFLALLLRAQLSPTAQRSLVQTSSLTPSTLPSTSVL
jgi:hypothetical protein